MGFIDQIYELAHEQKQKHTSPQREAPKTNNTHPHQLTKETKRDSHNNSLSDVLGEPKEKRHSVSDMVADEFRAPFHFDVSRALYPSDRAFARADGPDHGSVLTRPRLPVVTPAPCAHQEDGNTADENHFANAKRDARKKAADEAARTRRTDGSYLHAQPTGVSSVGSAQEKGKFASSTAAATDGTDYRPHADLRAKAAASGASTLLRRTSDDAVQTRMKIEEADMLQAERDRELRSQVIAEQQQQRASLKASQ
mmetsp:Transcript_4793/g.11861  ORF Transcript_4793/g.11861 Transcript_4793/m.11861 type:complete len:254 (-) Transcript_4793:425-1186(-)